MAGATHVPSLHLLGDFFSSKGDGTFLAQFFLAVPTFFLAVGSPISGGLIDRYGRKTILVFSIFLTGAAGLSGFFITSPIVLLYSRVVVGIALSGCMTAGTTLIADYFVGEERHRFLGWQAAALAFTGVVFLIFGGFLSQWGWQGPFLIYVTAILLGAASIFFVDEPIVKDPLIKNLEERPLRQVPKILLTALYFVGFLGAAIFYVLPTQISFFLKTMGSASAAKVSLVFGWSTLLSGFVALAYQTVKKRSTFSQIFFVVYLLVGIGYWMTAHSQTFSGVFVGLTIAGLGFGWQFVNLNSWLVAKVPAYWRGRAVGGLNGAIFMGQFVCPFISKPINGLYGSKAAFLWAGYLSLALVCSFALYMITGRGKKFRLLLPKSMETGEN